MRQPAFCLQAYLTNTEWLCSVSGCNFRIADNSTGLPQVPRSRLMDRNGSDMRQPAFCLQTYLTNTVSEVQVPDSPSSGQRSAFTVGRRQSRSTSRLPSTNPDTQTPDHFRVAEHSPGANAFPLRHPSIANSSTSAIVLIVAGTRLPPYFADRLRNVWLTAYRG